jgi:hypothetical protein
MSVNKRRYSRLDSVINGTFLSREDNAYGDIMLTNLSRDGFKASLSKPLVPGRIIQFQVRYPEQTMPVFTTGKVMWLKPKNQDATYGFDAGIHLVEQDSLNKQKAIEYDFDKWHIKQVAEFAQQKGYLAKHFPGKVLKLSSFIPSAFLLYFIAGAFVSFLSVKAALLFSASFLAYFLATFTTTIIWLLTEKSQKTFFEKVSLSIPVSAARISSHISYGAFFLRGLLSRKA